MTHTSTGAIRGAFNFRGNFAFSTAGEMWDALGVNALDQEKAQTSWLKPGNRTWAQTPLSFMQRSFVTAAAPPPFIALFADRGYSRYRVDIRTPRHLMAAIGHQTAREHAVSEFIIGTFAGDDDPEIIRIGPGLIGRNRLTDCLAAMRNILRDRDVLDDPARIDAAALTLKRIVRPSLAII